MDWVQNHMAAVLTMMLLLWVLWKRWIAPKLSGVKSIHASDYMNMRGDEHVLVDVRSPSEWQSGHATQAVHMALNEIMQRMHELPKDKPLVVICASGNRSAMAATRLAKSGFNHVYNFSGGMAAWQAAGLPIKKGA